LKETAISLTTKRRESRFYNKTSTKRKWTIGGGREKGRIPQGLGDEEELPEEKKGGMGADELKSSEKKELSKETRGGTVSVKPHQKRGVSWPQHTQPRKEKGGKPKAISYKKSLLDTEEKTSTH